MPQRTITSANSVFMLVVPGVFPAPVKIQGYAADDQFSVEAVQASETMMGVDGKMSAGFTPFITPMTVNLQADSESADLFELWLSSQQAIKEIIYGGATITIPSIGKSFILTKGALKTLKVFPDGKKVLQPVQYQIDWEQVVPVPLVT